jgi:hypothetical protein
LAKSDHRIGNSDLPPTGTGEQVSREVLFVGRGLLTRRPFAPDQLAERRVTDLKGLGIDFFAWSRDGKQLAIAAARIPNDVVLIDEVK